MTDKKIDRAAETRRDEIKSHTRIVRKQLEEICTNNASLCDWTSDRHHQNTCGTILLGDLTRAFHKAGLFQFRDKDSTDQSLKRLKSSLARLVDDLNIHSHCDDEVYHWYCKCSGATEARNKVVQSISAVVQSVPPNPVTELHMSHIAAQARKTGL
jgi:hypothetical protein